MHEYEGNTIVSNVVRVGDATVVTLSQKGHPETFWRASLAPSWAARMVDKHGPCENRSVGSRHLVVTWEAYGETMTRSCCRRAAENVLQERVSDLVAAG